MLLSSGIAVMAGSGCAPSPKRSPKISVSSIRVPIQSTKKNTTDMSPLFFLKLCPIAMAAYVIRHSATQHSSRNATNSMISPALCAPVMGIPNV